VPRGTSIASCQHAPLVVAYAVALSRADFAHSVARAFSYCWVVVARERADVLVPAECSVTTFRVQ
jgi:hypothetical protein